MIRNDLEYHEALQQLAVSRASIAEQQTTLREMGLVDEQVTRATAALRDYHQRMQEDIEWYDRAHHRDFEPIFPLADVGRLLISLRIAAGLNQRQLAERLDVSEAQVSRDERTEYRRITVERAQRILDALGASVTTTVCAQLTLARARLARSLAGSAAG